MTSLTVFKNNGIELVIDTSTGEAYATQAGYVKMSGKAKSTISERLEGVRGTELKTAKILTEGGLQGVRLIPAKLVFKWMLKDNSEVAEKMGEAGVTVYLHQLAGYKVTSDAVQPRPKTAIELLEIQLQIAKEHEQRLLKLEEENKALKEQLETVELETYANTCELERFRNGHGYWFTIVGWCNKHDLKPSLNQLKQLGKQASAMCRAVNIVPQKVNDERYGTVQSYPDSILAELTL